MINNTLFFDRFSGRFFKSNIKYIKRNIKNINKKIKKGKTITLNDYYDKICLSSIKMGDDLQLVSFIKILKDANISYFIIDFNIHDIEPRRYF